MSRSAAEMTDGADGVVAEAVGAEVVSAATPVDVVAVELEARIGANDLLSDQVQGRGSKRLRKWTT